MDSPRLFSPVPGLIWQRSFAMAVSAVDAALWDAKAKILDLPLVTLLGAARDCRVQSGK